MSVRELLRVVDRDVKRVHSDIMILAKLGLLERAEGGGVSCPYIFMHINMYLQTA
jgi:predicted transcriptional regulator